MSKQNQNKTTDSERAYAILSRPFAWDEVSVMPKSTADKNGQPVGLALVYFDARAVMARLDEAFGFMNWKWSVEIHPTDGIQPYARGVLTVRLPDGSETSRVEVCELTDIEPVKGGASGALKRAFTALGNRSLYEINLGWHPYKPNKRGGFGRWTESAQAEMRQRYERQVAELEKRMAERATSIVTTREPDAPASVPDVIFRVMGRDQLAYWADKFKRVGGNLNDVDISDCNNKDELGETLFSAYSALATTKNE